MFINYPKQHSQIDNHKWSKFATFKDYMGHCRSWHRMMVSNSISTSAHEGTHGIHAEIRNSARYGVAIISGLPQKIFLGKTNGTQGTNAFYVGQNRAIILQEPRLQKRQVAQFIPRNLRDSRFKVYITGQREWDNEPLYIYDEWVAYCNGTETHLDYGKTEWTDVAMGPLEFIIYAIGLCLAIEKHDPEYFQREHKFLKFTNWNYNRAMDLFRMAKTDYPWDKQDELLARFKTNNRMQDFVAKNLVHESLDESAFSLL